MPRSSSPDLRSGARFNGRTWPGRRAARRDRARLRDPSAGSRARRDLGDCDRPVGGAVGRGWAGRGVLRAFRPYWPSAVAILVLAGGYLLLTAARGKNPLGLYASATSSPYSAERIGSGSSTTCRALDRRRAHSGGGARADGRGRGPPPDRRADRRAARDRRLLRRLARGRGGNLGVVARRRHPRALCHVRRPLRAARVRGLPRARRSEPQVGALRCGARCLTPLVLPFSTLLPLGVLGKAPSLDSLFWLWQQSAGVVRPIFALLAVVAIGVLLLAHPSNSGRGVCRLRRSRVRYSTPLPG